MVSVALMTQNPGRLYRAMYCPKCRDIRLFRVDFIYCERNAKGYFVWYNRRCTGVHATDAGRPLRLLRMPRHCHYSREVVDMPLVDWEALVSNSYY